MARIALLVQSLNLLQLDLPPINVSLCEAANETTFETIITALCAAWAQCSTAETAETIRQTAVTDLLEKLGLQIQKPLQLSAISSLPELTKLRVLEYLVSAVHAERLIAANTSDQLPGQLNFLLSSALPNLSSANLVDSTVALHVAEKLQALPAGYYPPCLISPITLSSKQQETINEINSMMSAEYSLRRAMLLQRLDVTVESFGWQEKSQPKTQDGMDHDQLHQSRAQRMKNKYQQYRLNLSHKVEFSLYDVFSARTDLAQDNEQPISQQRVATSVRSIILGQVPDRGGRVTAASKKDHAASPHNSSRGGGHRGRGGNSSPQSKRSHGGNTPADEVPSSSSPHPGRNRQNRGRSESNRGNQQKRPKTS